jgi:tetratricopeptide (TPR) repeat protein
LNGLGNVYYHKEKYDEAITYFTKCLEINPKNNAPYNGLSNIYSKKGDEVEARAWYERKLAALSV